MHSSAGFSFASDITGHRHECADRDIFLKATGLAGLLDMQGVSNDVLPGVGWYVDGLESRL